MTLGTPAGDGFLCKDFSYNGQGGGNTSDWCGMFAVRFFFASFLAGIGKKPYLCGRKYGRNLPIGNIMEYISVMQFAEKYGVNV